ncbi:IPUT1 [Symbiodinium sp. CCMP2592]|nr:IPUT1 [Symbiodinium sp. CCMP2592]
MKDRQHGLNKNSSRYKAMAAKSSTFATLLTSDDFLMAVQALAASLRASTLQPLPLLVLHTSQVSNGVQSRLATDPSVQLRLVDAIPNPHKTDVSGWANSGFTKLRLWEQVDFAKIVYVDADCIILENIDELFARSCPAFCPDVFPPDKFNAGVIVLEPNLSVFQDMMDKMLVLPSHDGGDTGFLNAFFPDWYLWPPEQRLPFRYNALRTMYWFTHANPGYWESVQPVKALSASICWVLHFCSSPKPWDKEAKKGDLEALWWQYYLKSQMPF